jgi:hypothetical protein
LRLILFYILIFYASFTLAQVTIEGFKLQPSAGIHPDLKEVNFEVAEDIKVYYTTDGTPAAYNSNRLTSRTITVRGNTVFRFLVIDKNGEKHQFSQTYLINRPHSIPVLTIATDPAHFFDSLTGIYEKGCCADTVNPYMGANFWKQWEKPVHIEYYNEKGEQVLNQACGVRIFGGYSKAMPQKSLALFARDKYGDNRFRYPFFQNNELKKHKNIVLRNAGGDMLGAHIRDVYATQLAKEIGLLVQDYQPAAVYINGEYWGKYNLREKINEHFINAHFGYPKDSLIIMRHNGDHQHGPPGDYRKFIKRLENLDLTKKEAIAYVDKKMDILNYITYNIAQVYTGNGDAGGNIRYYKSMRDTAKWRWIFYDLDIGMNINGSHEYKHNSFIDFTTRKDELWPNPPWSTLIIRKLLENDSIKQLYINRFLDLLNTTFHPERGLALINKLTEEVKDEIPHHLKRWHITQGRYDKSVNDIKLFAEKRPGVLLDHLRTRFELGEVYRLIINWDIEDNEKGFVRLNTIGIASNFEGNYFNDVPITLEASPRYDYEFIGWEGIDVTEKRITISNPSDKKVIIRPIFKKRAYSNLQGKLIISEIDATQKNSAGDYIELYNLFDAPIAISGFQLRDKNDENVFVFPNQVELKPNEHAVIVQNREAFCATYNCDSILVIGSFEFGIAKKSDKVRLYDQHGMLIDLVDLKELTVENEGANWTKKDYRIVNFYVENWVQEPPSPGSKSAYYEGLLKQEEKDQRNKMIFLYTGIGTGTLAMILFFVYFVRQQHK